MHKHYLCNLTVAEVNCQGVIILIVTSIIVTVALRDDIVKCCQAIDLRGKGTSGRGTGPSPGGKTGVLPVTTIVGGKWVPARFKYCRILVQITHTLLAVSQLLHPLWGEQLAAAAKVARPAAATTLVTINLVKCIVERRGILLENEHRGAGSQRSWCSPQSIDRRMSWEWRTLQFQRAYIPLSSPKQDLDNRFDQFGLSGWILFESSL